MSTPRNGFVSAGRATGSGQGQGQAPIDAGSNESLAGTTDGSAATSGGTGVAGASGTAGTANSGKPGASAGGSTPSGGPASGGGSTAGGGSAVGVTKDSITVSFVGDFSGAGAALTPQAYDGGFMTWVDDVNARGGIRGRKVVPKKVDHQDTAAGGVAACKEVGSNGSFMATVPQGTLGSNATVDCLDKAGMQTLSNAVVAPPSWRRAFLYTPTAEVQGRVLSSFVNGFMKDGGKKIGVIFTNVSGMVEFKDSFVKSSKAAGMNIVDVEAVEANQSSFVPQLTRLRDAGAEHVAMIVLLEAPGILRDARALTYAPRFSAGRWTLDVVSTAARDLAKDVQGVKVATTVDQPAFQEFLAKQKKYGRDSAASSAIAGEIMLAYGVGLVLEQMLASAGPSPTKESLFQGTTAITAYDSKILPPVTYRADRLDGPREMFPVICCTPEYKWKGLGLPRATFT